MNKIIESTEAREGLRHVEYENGLTLSISTGPGSYSHKMHGIPVTVEVAVLDGNSFVPLTEWDDVAHIPIAEFEELCAKMEELSSDKSQAILDITHYLS
tara:strand:+ start:1898 stop:2194 length:297 start_codon:yes stop_codon:yes gene_type:complete